MAKLVFGGVQPYIDTANTATHSLTPAQVLMAKSLTPVVRAQQALGQAVEGPQTAGHQNACIAEALKWHDVLALAADGVERAMQAVITNYSLSAQTYNES